MCKIGESKCDLSEFGSFAQSFDVMDVILGPEGGGGESSDESLSIPDVNSNNGNFCSECQMLQDIAAAGSKNIGTLWTEVGKGQDSFSDGNIIHKIFGVESEMVDPEDMHKANLILKKIFYLVKEELKKNPDLTSQQKIAVVYDAIERVGITMYGGAVSFVSQGLSDGRFDCDTSSYIVKAVADEFGWPLNLVLVPGKHMFSVWEGDDEKFAIDNGKMESYFYDKTQFYLSSGEMVYIKSEDKILAVVHTVVGFEKKEMGQLEGSIASLSKAIDLRVDDVATLHYMRGKAYYESGQDDNALRDFQKSIELDGNGASPYGYLGAILFYKEDFDGAIEALSKAVELDGDAVDCYYLGLALYEKGDMDGAIEALSKAAKLDEDDPDYRDFLNFILEEKSSTAQ